MGYFDFLMAGPNLPRQEDNREGGSDVPVIAENAAELSPSEAAHLQSKNVLRNAFKEKLKSIVKGTHPSTNKKLLDTIIDTTPDPKQTMDLLGVALKNEPTFESKALLDPRRKELEADVEAYNRLLATPEEAKIRQRLQNIDQPIAQQKVPGREESLKAMEEKERFAVGETLKKTQKAILQQGPFIEETRQRAGMVQPSPSTTAPHETFESHVKAAGMEPEGAYRAMLELSSKLGVNLDEPVPARVGLMTAAQAIPEFGQELVDFANQASGFRYVAPGGDTLKAQQTSTPQQVEQAELDRKIKELGQQQEFQSWPSILAFVVLSMAIGPKLAFLFFSNAAKKGQLRYEIDNIRNRMKEQAIRQKSESDFNDFLRKEAAKSGIRSQEKAVDRSERFRQQWQLTMMKLAMRQQQATKDPTTEKLVGQFNRLMKQAGALGQIGKFEEAEAFIDAAKQTDDMISQAQAK